MISFWFDNLSITDSSVIKSLPEVTQSIAVANHTIEENKNT